MTKTQIAILLGIFLVPLASNGETLPPGHPPADPAASSAYETQTMQWQATGKVIETMDSGGYTYVQVDTGTEKVWAAAPAFKVKVGDEVSIPKGSAMEQYFSKKLDRTFDSILFVSMVQVVGQPMPVSTTEEHQGRTATVDAGISGVEKAEGGRNIAELFDQKSALATKEVVLRGKVVKFSSGIMGTNFAHIQDGTTSSSGMNDLTVTTDAIVKVGDTVLVKGVLSADKDFGYGYTYDVIIENASLTVE